jgi:D-alanine-D-alanine ligase
MVGIPYVASGPLAHSLALDKVVTKMILRQHQLPTPDFAVLESPDSAVPELPYPVVVKPKNEAVSFGLKVVDDEEELRDAASVIFKEFGQAVLAEQYIEGREINVGVLGNSPPEAFPPVQLDFGEEGPAIYTYADKTGRSGRSIGHTCPAPIGDELAREAKEIAVRTFRALGLYDCARIDMRLDGKDKLYILEANSLPSLGEHGSYLVGAAEVGLDFTRFVNRLVEIASARYFGTPEPPQVDRKTVDPKQHVLRFITSRRDQLEKRLRDWVATSSRTTDPIGPQRAARHAERLFKELGLKTVPEFTDPPDVWLWETSKGFDDGTLFIAHLDVPIDVDFAPPVFRRDPEWLYGEGIGSRASLVMLEYALRSIRSIRRLKRLPLGVLLYTDEGLDARKSGRTIRAAAAQAKKVFVLRPGNPGDYVIVQRRGQRKYRLRVEGEPLRLGRPTKKQEVLRWTWNKLDECAALTSPQERVSVSTTDIRTERLPMRLPHRVIASIAVTYPDGRTADAIEEKMRALLGKRGPRWGLELLSDRPPMPNRRGGARLAKALETVAQELEIPLKRTSSAWPSVAGLVPAKVDCLCGVGPVAKELRSPEESVQRISLVQRSLLLADYLAKEVSKR